MTLSILTYRADYTADGATKTYAVPFPFQASSQIKVLVRLVSSGVKTELVLNTDYSVAGAGDVNGGSITLLNAAQAWLTSGNLSVGYKLIILRKLNLDQPTDIRNADKWPAEEIEDTEDYRVQQLQLLKELIDRCLKIPEDEPGGAAMTLLSSVARANQYLGFDVNGAFKTFIGALANPDHEWCFSDQLDTSHNGSFPTYLAPRATSFVKFDAVVNTAPTGAAILVDWYLNDVLVPSARVTIAAGQKSGSTNYIMSLVAGDRLQPQLAQVGSGTPGSTINCGARGS